MALDWGRGPPLSSASCAKYNGEKERKNCTQSGTHDGPFFLSTAQQIVQKSVKRELISALSQGAKEMINRVTFCSPTEGAPLLFLCASTATAAREEKKFFHFQLLPLRVIKAL